MKIYFAALLALAVTVAALPSNDNITPEMSFMEQSYAEAKETVRMMQARGQNDNACRDLAEATEKEVKDNVKTAQELMDKSDRGESCKDEGKPAIKQAEDAKKEADDKYKDAKKKCEDAKEAQVDFPSYALSSLTEGQCGQFFASSAFQDAKSKRTTACDASKKAEGEASQAKKDVEKAKEAAKTLVSACQCKVWQKHEESLKEANEKFDQSNIKAWTKAAHLKCVLDGKTTDQCTVPPLPKVKAVKLADGVSGDKCECPDGPDGPLQLASTITINQKHPVVKAYIWNGGARTLTWDIEHNFCKSHGKKSPGSTDSRYMNKYCSYSSNDNFAVTSTCNWSSQSFTHKCGKLQPTQSNSAPKGYMCAHSNCDHQVVTNQKGEVHASNRQVNIYNGDAIMCSDGF